MTSYPPETKALVHVTFTDGEVKTYPISAGTGIGRWLAQEMHATGTLTLFTHERSHSIRAEQIREYEIEAFAQPTENAE